MRERTDLKWAESKLKNPKRSTLKPTPWEEVSDGKYLIKFSWNDEKRPPVVDTEGTPITNTDTPVYSGSKVKLGFTQKPYITKRWRDLWHITQIIWSSDSEYSVRGWY